MDDQMSSAFIGEEDLGSMLAGMSPGDRAAFLGHVGMLQARARAQQGEAAFDMPRSAAAIHEAGHAVYAAVEGRRVLKVKIFRRTVNGRRLWLGTTYDERSEWFASPFTPDAADLSVARNKIAGVVAEHLFEPKPRAGSSLDEVALFGFLCAGAAPKLDRWAHEIAVEQDAIVDAALRRHEATVRDIAAALIRHRKLRGHRLDRFLAPVYRATSTAGDPGIRNRCGYCASMIWSQTVGKF